MLSVGVVFQVFLYLFYYSSVLQRPSFSISGRQIIVAYIYEDAFSEELSQRLSFVVFVTH